MVALKARLYIACSPAGIVPGNVVEIVLSNLQEDGDILRYGNTVGVVALNVKTKVSQKTIKAAKEMLSAKPEI